MPIKLEEFSKYAKQNKMELEAILAGVYADYTAGKKNFALFDGGAHKGYHTTRMAALPGVKRVYAVEADPFMAEKLRSNLAKGKRRKISIFSKAKYRNISIIEAALQDDPATVSIPWKSSTSHVGRSSIVSKNSGRSTIWQDNATMEYRDEMTVAATMIDTVLTKERRAIPFLKLDLEGADLMALRGGHRTLETKRPVVAFENSVHAPEVHGFTLEEMAAYFSKLNYVPMNFVGEKIGPDNWFGFHEAWAAPTEAADWLSAKVQEKIQKRMG